MPEARDFTLGQVMDIWACDADSGSARLFFWSYNGYGERPQVAGDPALIPLTQHAEIVLNVGGPSTVPPPISWTGTGL